MNPIHLGTELQEQYQISTGFPSDAPLGSSIRGHHRTPLSETTLMSSVDRRSEAPIVKNTNSMNLSEQL
jgi:hypothetical protein